MTITELLALARQYKASDLHLSAGLVPMIRVDGDLQQVQGAVIEHQELAAMLSGLMDDMARKAWEHCLEADFSIAIEHVGRFRVNAFNQARGAAAVLLDLFAGRPSWAFVLLLGRFQGVFYRRRKRIYFQRASRGSKFEPRKSRGAHEAQN